MYNSKFVSIEKKFVNRIFAALFLFGITLMFLLMLFVPVTTVSTIDMSSPLGVVLSLVENGNTDERIFSVGIMFIILFSLFVLIPYSVISTIAFIKFIIALVKGNDTGIISQFISALVLYIMGAVITYNFLQNPGGVFPLVYVVIVFGFLVIVGYSVLAHFLYGSLKENYKMLIFAGARAFFILMIILLLLGGMFLLNNHMLNFADYSYGRVIGYESEETYNFASISKGISELFNIGILFSLVFIFKTVLLNLLTKKTSCFSTSSLIFNIFANTYVLVVLFQAIVLDNGYKSFSTNPKSADYLAYNETVVKETFSDIFDDFGDVTARFLGTKFFAIFLLVFVGYALLIGSVVLRIVLNNIKKSKEQAAIYEPRYDYSPKVEEPKTSDEIVVVPVAEKTTSTSSNETYTAPKKGEDVFYLDEEEQPKAEDVFALDDKEAKSDDVFTLDDEAETAADETLESNDTEEVKNDNVLEPVAEEPKIDEVSEPTAETESQINEVSESTDEEKIEILPESNDNIEQ